jgi:hypothetical protein
MLRQREPRERDEAHLRFVREQPCCLGFCQRQAEAAHLRMSNPAIGKEAAGKGEKPHDKFTVPLCPYHHRTGVDSQHNSNERAWWEMRGIDPWTVAASLWIQSGGAARALEPKPALRPSKIKSRKPPAQRASIHNRGFSTQHRPLVSRSSFERHQG